MYVCICRQITQEQVQSLVEKGKNSKEIVRTLGVGSDCGTCLIDGVEKIISAQPLSQKQSSNKKS